jgi:hypothetical protein
MAGPACVVVALLLPLGSALFGRFFGFDFQAELFVFGVFGFTAFAFVVGCFFVSRFDVTLFLVGFYLVGFDLGVVGPGGDRRRRRGGDRRRRRGGEIDGVRRRSRGEQQQRDEQRDQQDRESAHLFLIGAKRRPR